MAPGWPDIVCAKAGNRLIFMELKAQLGELDPDQLVWATLLNSCGARAIIVRPSDLREGRGGGGEVVGAHRGAPWERGEVAQCGIDIADGVGCWRHVSPFDVPAGTQARAE